MSPYALALVFVAFVAAGCTTALAPAPRLTRGEVARGFVPIDPADKELLRSKLRDRAAAMNALSCKVSSQ